MEQELEGAYAFRGCIVTTSAMPPTRIIPAVENTNDVVEPGLEINFPLRALLGLILEKLLSNKSSWFS